MPDSTCGLLFAADILEPLDTSVTLVMLPLCGVNNNGHISRYKSWAEVPSAEFGKNLSGSFTLHQKDMKILARRWRELQQENAPLRALVNGRAVSVGLDFYDEMIRHIFNEGEMKVVEIIGKMIGHYQLEVGEWLIAKRIQWMIDMGELNVVKNCETCFYEWIVVPPTLPCPLDSAALHLAHGLSPYEKGSSLV